MYDESDAHLIALITQLMKGTGWLQTLAEKEKECNYTDGTHIDTLQLRFSAHDNDSAHSPYSKE